jgi:hypothetical protein
LFETSPELTYVKILLTTLDKEISYQGNKKLKMSHFPFNLNASRKGLIKIPQNLLITIISTEQYVASTQLFFENPLITELKGQNC